MNFVNMSVEKARALFFVYAAIQGVIFSYVFLIYTATSIASAFFITSSMFGGMSIYGYSVRKNLTAMGTFLHMGLIGVIVAIIVNLFLASSMLDFVISIFAIIIFAGLTAYDTQRLKHLYYSVGGTPEIAARVAIYGALSLYLDFINMFLYILRFVGTRRGD